MSEPIQSIAQNNYILHNIDAKKLYVQEPLFTANSGDAVYVGWRPDETVLCSAEGGAFSLTASENIYNFEYIDVWQAGGTDDVTMRIPTKYIARNNKFETTKTFLTFNSELYTFGATYSVSNNGTVLESTGRGYGYVVNVATTAGLTKFINNQYNGKISKVVGVNRISGSNI